MSGQTPGRRFKVLVCRGPECGDKRHSRGLYDAFRVALGDAGVERNVDLGWQSCFGRCTQGPNCLVREISQGPASEHRFVLATPPPRRRGRNALYNGVTKPDIPEIVERHIVGGELVRRLIQRPARTRSEPIKPLAVRVRSGLSPSKPESNE